MTGRDGLMPWRGVSPSRGQGRARWAAARRVSRLRGRPALRTVGAGGRASVIGLQRAGGFTSTTSISTSMPGDTSPATCTVERAGSFGCSFVPKYRL